VGLWVSANPMQMKKQRLLRDSVRIPRQARPEQMKIESWMNPSMWITIAMQYESREATINFVNFVMRDHVGVLRNDVGSYLVDV
jgi:hypothetical protein